MKTPDTTVDDQVKSVDSNQHNILKNILYLNGLDRFDADITYGKGSFYKQVLEPKFKYDIDPQTDDTIKADSTDLPIPDNSFDSVVFDPPFLTYIKNARSHGSIMSSHYGGYWKYEELAEHYQKTLKEAHRVLRPKGILVFKCQDIIHNHAMHPTHINIVQWADDIFRLKDMFILYKNNRLPMPSKDGEKSRQQKHARIHHSYFLVLEAQRTANQPDQSKIEGEYR